MSRICSILENMFYERCFNNIYEWLDECEYQCIRWHMSESCMNQVLDAMAWFWHTVTAF